MDVRIFEVESSGGTNNGGLRGVPPIRPRLRKSNKILTPSAGHAFAMSTLIASRGKGGAIRVREPQLPRYGPHASGFRTLPRETRETTNLGVRLCSWLEFRSANVFAHKASCTDSPPTLKTRARPSRKHSRPYHFRSRPLDAPKTQPTRRNLRLVSPAAGGKWPLTHSCCRSTSNVIASVGLSQFSSEKEIQPMVPLLTIAPVSPE